MRFFSYQRKKEGKRMEDNKALSCEVSVVFTALVFVEMAYRQGLINKKTYQSVIKKHGGEFYDRVHD